MTSRGDCLAQLLSLALGAAVLPLTGCEGLALSPGVSLNTPGSTTEQPPGQNQTGPQTCDGNAGHTALRRLTNAEYSNTVQDLLFTTARPGDSLQEGAAGVSGYTNDALAATMYPALVGATYDQAEALAKALLATKGTAGGAYAKVVTCDPAQAACAQATVTKLARRALRRQPTAADLDASSGLMAVFAAGGSFDQGLSDVVVSLLIHPEFLMIPVVDAQSLDPAASFALDDDELASRLSYFLWQSMPDEALFAAADAKSLHQPATLAQHVSRMLADPRALHLKDLLRDEYAGLKAFSRADFTQLGQPNALRDALVGETDAFFADLIKNDRSALTILSGQLTFANKTLADFYGLTFPTGASPTSFVPIAAGRTGLTAQGAVLVATAGGSATFTNPVKRGHWLVSKVLCSDPPPPPPNVPALPPASSATPTIRARLDAHVSQPACQGCHKVMDNVGLGAENFDALGRWRTTYADGSPVDSAGNLPDGTTFADSKAMASALAAQDQAKACVAQQFMKVALNRALAGSDSCTANRLALANLTDTGSLSGLLTQLASSPQFLMQTGEAP